MRSSCLMLVLIGIGIVATTAHGSGPADDLFRLVPADSGMTLAVEDLRGHSKVLRESPLFDGLGRLASVRSWLASDPFRMVERSAKEMQKGLGVSLEVIRDDLLGDAVIFALQPGPATQPDLAQGLLLVRPRDRELIPRLVKTLNEIQTRSGELDRVEPKSRGGLTYSVRQFKAGQRPPEYYVQLGDGTFAWSNSEGMIYGVIDRKAATGAGLGDDPGFQKIRRGLPDRALLSLFVNPRLFERLLTEASKSSKTSEDRVASLLARYVGAVVQVGFALEWRDGFVLHSHEVLEPRKLDAWLRRWLTRPPSPAVGLDRVPSTAVAVVSANLDFQALGEAARSLVPDADRESFTNLELVAQGFLLGHDPMTAILPRLNPGALVYLDVEPSPAGRPSFPWVAVIGWQKNREGVDDLSGPIDNALRTLLALVALDPKQREAHLKVETRPEAEARLTSLMKGAQAVIAYRAGRDRLVIGNSTDAIDRFATGSTNAKLAEFRAQYVAGAETFALVDVQGLVSEIRRRQAPIVRHLAARSHRPVDATERDLVQLVAVAELFRAFTFATVTSKDATEIHRSVGLFAR